MKLIFNSRGSAKKDIAIPHIPKRVCMHVLGTARNDSRVMRSATALVKAGFKVSIIDIERDKACPVKEDICGVFIEHIIMPSWFVYSTHFDPMFLFRVFVVLIRSLYLLLRTRADIYHAHDEMALPACYIASKVHSKPLIFDAHELPLAVQSVRWIGLKKLRKHFLSKTMPDCEAVITVSPYIVKEIEERYYCRNVVLLRNVPEYRDVPKSNCLQQYLGLSSNTRIALYQGNLQPDRGLDTLIRSARFLEHNIVIILMGRAVRDIQSQLEELILNEGVEDRVKIIPPVPYKKLLNWTSSADIGLLLLPPDYSLSIRMCLPNKLFEYMMAGLPILTSPLDAVSEVIQSYKIGQIAPSLEPVNIGASINNMMSDPDALARMRNNALEASLNEFHWEKESEHLIYLYNDIKTRLV